MKENIRKAIEQYLRYSHNRMLTQYHMRHKDIERLILNVDFRELFEAAKATQGKLVQGSAYDRALSDIQDHFKEGLKEIIVNSMLEGFTTSNRINNELIMRAYNLKENVAPELFKLDTQKWNTLKNRQLFKGRTLSGRIWTLSNDYKRDIQDALQIGLSNGDSAVEIAKRLERYSLYANEKLIDIDKLTDVEVRKAVARRSTSKRGSMGTVFKDAKRLAGNETNIAYREGEQNKWSTMGCVQAQQINLSNAHPREDICDPLAGVYPLSFKWNGWHPQCLCFRTPVMMNRDQFLENIKRKRDGKAPIMDGMITEMPQGFKDYMRVHYSRMNSWKSKPYFMIDNDIPSLIK